MQEIKRTEQHKAHGWRRRVLIRYWCETNGRLHARLYTITPSTVSVTEIWSPSFLGKPEDAKGKMFHWEVPTTLGRAFVAELAKIEASRKNKGWRA